MTEKMDPTKEALAKHIDENAEFLWRMAMDIHGRPELCFEELEALKTLTAPLEEKGFTVTRGIAGLETAFEATWQGKAGGPTILLLAEYDALPEIGHACGHNLIGPISVGAALALKEVFPELRGTVKVVGTPAEEGGGGKIFMAEKGYFDDADIVMMCHPKSKTMVARGGIACTHLTMKFFGKATHASSSPEVGVSALDAVIHSFVAINSLRQFVRDGVRIHGIITNGGVAPNIVPDYGEAKFLVRAPKISELYEVRDKVLAAASHSAEAVGARFEYEEGLVYAERNNNLALADLFASNLEALGEPVSPPPERGGLGSSDIGNVSQLVPTIHPYIKIAPDGVTNHTKEFAEAAASPEAKEGLLKAAKALAFTAYDIFSKDEALKAIRDEFEAWKKEREGK